MLVATTLDAGASTGVAPALSSTHGTAVLAADGLGAVRFGTSKPHAVDHLRALFGTPNWRGINTGCGARWTEVVWGDLAAEFTGDVFTGYRYASAVLRRFTERVPATTGFPRLATAEAITVGSTLSQVRSAYRLHLSGAGRWHSGSLEFVSNAQHSPAPLTSRIIEIKTTSTCGDY
jgi:hypothetical protein